LGFNVRHYAMPTTTRSGFKLLIKPSKKAVVGKRAELRDVWLSLQGHNVQAVLRKLNPIIRGWANYYRRKVASAVFQQLDYWMRHRVRRYLKHTHPHKPWRWLRQRYFGELNKERKNVQVFGDKNTGRYLLRFGWFEIVRHVLVRGKASPDDASLREYWWKRGKVNAAHLTPSDRKLALVQGWVCRLCGMALMNGEDLHRHHKNPKAMGGFDTPSNRELVHPYCHQQETYRQFKDHRQVPTSDEQLETCSE
jgi:RNA-directed DNA polymerase